MSVCVFVCVCVYVRRRVGVVRLVYVSPCTSLVLDSCFHRHFYRLPPAVTMPEDEVRSCTVELKLGHEAKLKALLQTVGAKLCGLGTGVG